MNYLLLGNLLKLIKLILEQRKHKLENVGDYWDDATISKITELLHEYHDLFPTKFTDVKGIKGPMGEMKIHLKVDARYVK